MFSVSLSPMELGTLIVAIKRLQTDSTYSGQISSNEMAASLLLSNDQITLLVERLQRIFRGASNSDCPDEPAKQGLQSDAVLLWPVDKLELSIRGRHILKKMGIATIGDLIKLTPDELMSQEKLGAPSFAIIISELTKLGLSLST